MKTFKVPPLKPRSTTAILLKKALRRMLFGGAHTWEDNGRLNPNREEGRWSFTRSPEKPSMNPKTENPHENSESH